MWKHETSIETTASPAAIWRLFADVPGWKRWNAGIEQIEIHGPFAKGTSFFMQPPGDNGFTSTLIEVSENIGFTDETIIGDTRVVVHHRIIPMSYGKTTIAYCTEITGPDAAQFGPMVTGDFHEVLAALKALAESITYNSTMA